MGTETDCGCDRIKTKIAGHESKWRVTVAAVARKSQEEAAGENECT